MYKILGSDGKIYGPIPAETLRLWVAEGRVNGSTLIQVDEATDWRPLSSLPQFAVPPPLSMPAPSAAPTPARRQSSELALLGLISSVLGCVCCCCGTPFALLGLVLSLIALMDAQGRDRSLAIAGLVVAILALGMHLLLGWANLAVTPWAWHYRHWNFR
jgi:hypothetical protein